MALPATVDSRTPPLPTVGSGSVYGGLKTACGGREIRSLPARSPGVGACWLSRDVHAILAATPVMERGGKMRQLGPLVSLFLLLATVEEMDAERRRMILEKIACHQPGKTETAPSRLVWMHFWLDFCGVCAQLIEGLCRQFLHLQLGT